MKTRHKIVLVNFEFKQCRKCCRTKNIPNRCYVIQVSIPWDKRIFIAVERKGCFKAETTKGSVPPSVSTESFHLVAGGLTLLILHFLPVNGNKHWHSHHSQAETQQGLRSQQLHQEGNRRVNSASSHSVLTATADQFSTQFSNFTHNQFLKLNTNKEHYFVFLAQSHTLRVCSSF